MKTRIIASVVLVPLLLIVLLVAPKVMTAVLLGVMCAIAAYELLWGTGLVRHVRLVAYTMVLAFFVPFWVHNGMEHLWALLGVFVYFCLLFGEVLLAHAKLRFDRIAICMTGGLLLPYLLCALLRILDSGSNGRMLVLIPFVIAFLSDSGAYFVGKAWGKHKLAPVVSPNKSVEGMLGGMITAVLGMLLYCLVVGLVSDEPVKYLYAITYGLLGSAAGVFGDLCFSAVKRQTGIKDYGNLIPGHGGILDRFDSVMVVAPLVEILLALLPVVG